MDSLGPNRFDIFEIYRRFCELTTGYEHVCDGEGYRQGEESQRAKFTRDALNQLLKMVESRMRERHVYVDFSVFSCFYDFVFFVCRENGQKNITVSRAVAAWRLVLAGRFRLLNQWCDFVEKNQRHNISEDTWQQVLAFSRCVHETLEGYDPEGAWPVLSMTLLSICTEFWGRIKIQMVSVAMVIQGPSCVHMMTLCPDLKLVPGLKRKLRECNNDKMESLEPLFSSSPNPNCTSNSKRRCRSDEREDNLSQNSCDESMEIVNKVVRGFFQVSMCS
ncbi:hypothetical protein CXB51_003940 [Gossypium anomalum]|uniref:Defective in cullin neddylation protein n=1 Tax=Gossypium anomalum TaxID=47600 RepID=A0A8J6A126_9ROSI|nr:hypothetical protein CXB51_003940 [Gossypium anomalum]